MLCLGSLPPLSLFTTGVPPKPNAASRYAQENCFEFSYSGPLPAQRPYCSSRLFRGLNPHNVREATTNDYAGICRVHNANYPDDLLTPERLKSNDARRDPRAQFKRWVVEKNGEIVGVGGFGQPTALYHPQKFTFSIFVHPDHQGTGIGRSLYDRIHSTLMSYDPISLRTITQEAHQESIRFLENRRFREEMRSWQSYLDVASADTSQLDETLEKLTIQDIAIKTLGSLKNDSYRDNKLHALWNQLNQDVPAPETLPPLSQERFMQLVINSPRVLTEGVAIAVHGTEYIGVSALFTTAKPSELYNDLTGVSRNYRHLGIARALKLRNIAFARESGYRSITTVNDSRNQAILSLNEALGFQRGPAWLSFIKEFPDHKAST